MRQTAIERVRNAGSPRRALSSSKIARLPKVVAIMLSVILGVAGLTLSVTPSYAATPGWTLAQAQQFIAQYKGQTSIPPSLVGMPSTCTGGGKVGVQATLGNCVALVDYFVSTQTTTTKVAFSHNAYGVVDELVALGWTPEKTVNAQPTSFPAVVSVVPANAGATHPGHTFVVVGQSGSKLIYMEARCSYGWSSVVATTDTWNNLRSAWGGTFKVAYPKGTVTPSTSGAAGYVAAFQANTSHLWTIINGVAKDTGYGLMKDTSPAITKLTNGGYAIAFQANVSTHLWTIVNGVAKDTGYGMMKGTSPAITAMPNGNYAVVFQANTSHLWTIINGVAKDTGYGLMKDTSPAITKLTNGGYAIAFQANVSTHLWTIVNGVAKDTGYGMMKGTSPAITAMPNGNFEAAFQANTGSLWTYGVDTRDRRYGMMAGTSPSIASVGSTYAVAFQANTSYLWTIVDGTASERPYGMLKGTSPSITGMGNSYEVGFQANVSTHLWTSGSDSHGDWYYGMMAGTSPAVAG